MHNHRAATPIVARARSVVGLTQADVSQRLGRPHSFVAKYKGGERRLNVIEFIAVVQALGQETVEMFGQLVSAG